jgi:guanylate kinase
MIEAPRLVVVVSGPSGAGKSTLCTRFTEAESRCSLIVTTTTRERRNGEVDGEDYHFVSEDEFKKGIENDEFLEYARVHDNYYGSPKRTVENTLREGKDVILEIDVQGGLAVKQRIPDAVLIFVIPSDLSVLRQRLTDRRTDSPEVIEKRLVNARREIEKMSSYNYVIFNDNAIEDAVCLLGKIIETERHCIRRYDTARLFDPKLLSRTSTEQEIAK